MLQVTEPMDRFMTALEQRKIKGETDFMLYDIVTKKTEVFHDENMITGALSKLFKSNLGGLIPMNQFLPIKDIIGGIFLFNSALTESDSAIWPDCRANNRLVGHAGQTTHSTSSQTRGNPNGAASWVHPDDGQVRFAWDFALEQANDGPINSCALTNPLAGDCGLYPDGTLPLLKPYGQMISGVSWMGGNTAGGQSWTRARAAQYPIALDSNGYGLSMWISGTTFEELKVRHPFVKAELIEGPQMNGTDHFTIVSSRTATLSRSFTPSYTQIAQDDSYYYVMERAENDNTVLYLNVIDKSDMSVSAATITVTGVTLARPIMRLSALSNGIVNDGNIYWVSGSSAKTFVRINIATPADVEVLQTNMTDDISLDQMPISKTAGLILGRNFLINDDTVYPVALRDMLPGPGNINGRGYECAVNYDGSPMFYENMTAWTDSDLTSISSCGLLYLPHLISANNLNNPVDKNANKTLRVQYTLSIMG